MQNDEIRNIDKQTEILYPILIRESEYKDGN